MDASTQTIPPPRRHADHSVNVGDGERWLSLLGGGLLALATVRRALGPAVLLGAAGALLYRGWTGQCALYQTMGVCTASHEGASDRVHRVAGPDEPPLVVLAAS